MSDELSWKSNVPIWWDPVPPWILRELGDVTQQEIISIALEAQASMLQTHATALREISGKLRGGGQAKR